MNIWLVIGIHNSEWLYDDIAYRPSPLTHRHTIVEGNAASVFGLDGCPDERGGALRRFVFVSDIDAPPPDHGGDQVQICLLQQTPEEKGELLALRGRARLPMRPQRRGRRLAHVEHRARHLPNLEARLLRMRLG